MAEKDSGDMSLGMFAVFILVALMIDGLQAFLDFIVIGLLLNPIISLLCFIFFSIVFLLVGIRFTTGRAVGLAVTTFLEALPSGMLPMWTGYVIYTYAVKVEKKVRKALQSKEKLSLISKYAKKALDAHDEQNGQRPQDSLSQGSGPFAFVNSTPRQSAQVGTSPGAEQYQRRIMSEGTRSFQGRQPQDEPQGVEQNPQLAPMPGTERFRRGLGSALGTRSTGSESDSE